MADRHLIQSLIPSIDAVLQRPALTRAAAAHGRNAIVAAARRAAAELRDRLATGAAGATGLNVGDEDAAARWIESRAIAILQERMSPSLQRVINATGVIVHTNLGRAPLAAAASNEAARLARGYTNLEFDLEEGARGNRHAHAGRLLQELTGAEAALVVNNAAAAALLAMAALARGREVIVSRGELVEIGGGFRVPDVLAQSGAILREVGTTNRTRAADYSAALNDRTALILRVHPSNFHQTGFVERPPLAEISVIAHRFNVPLVEDLGSGWLGVADTPAPIASEPSVRASLAAGADLVVFSGDKLLGGPQAGIILGRADLIRQLATHPLMRAVRVDKLTYAALEETLRLWAEEPARLELPLFRMLTMPAAEIQHRSDAIRLAVHSTRLQCELREGVSTVGGGSAPGSEIPTILLVVRLSGASADACARQLRQQDPPIITRIQDDAVVLDLRTVLPDEDAQVVTALQALG